MISGAVVWSFADFKSSFGEGLDAHGHLNRCMCGTSWMVSGSGCLKVSGRKKQSRTPRSDREATMIQGRSSLNTASCSRYGEIEDPTLENMAQVDIAVFLMTVGDSSPVYTYITPMPDRMPNLPSSTRDRVSAG